MQALATLAKSGGRRVIGGLKLRYDGATPLLSASLAFGEVHDVVAAQASYVVSSFIPIGSSV